MQSIRVDISALGTLLPLANHFRASVFLIGATQNRIVGG
jgi:hypothetical protein